MSWINDIENVDIETGDKVAVRCVSEHDAFDGDVEMRVESVSGHPTYMLEAKTNGPGVIAVAPATGEDYPAEVLSGRAIRGTGHIANSEHVAWAEGIEGIIEEEEA